MDGAVRVTQPLYSPNSISEPSEIYDSCQQPDPTVALRWNIWILGPLNVKCQVFIRSSTWFSQSYVRLRRLVAMWLRSPVNLHRELGASLDDLSKTLLLRGTGPRGVCVSVPCR